MWQPNLKSTQVPNFINNNTRTITTTTPHHYHYHATVHVGLQV
jgi:hypothetical protein